MKPVRNLAALLLIAVLAGCGGDTDSESAQETPEEGAAEFPEDRYTDEEIAESLDLKNEGSGYYSLSTPDGPECEGILLNGAATVSLYVDAGDVVATNTAQTVGIKITENERECHAAFTEALADL